MSLDVVDLRTFYLEPLGHIVQRILGARLRKAWPDVRGKTILTVGYGTPLLRPWLEEGGSTLLAMMPGRQGAVFWPSEGPNRVCLADEADLPLADESVDGVILMHALEATTYPEGLLREAWRVVKSHGRVMVIVPNRHGLWAHSDRTPFGTGSPYSASQLRTLLRTQGFSVERTWRALYGLPSASWSARALANALEKSGPYLFPGLAGLLLMEARKEVYAPLLTKSYAARPRVVLPLPFPTTSRSL